MLVPINKLHILAQQKLYKSFLFTKPKEPTFRQSSLPSSFEQKLFSSYLMNPYTSGIPLWIFSKCRVLEVRGSFLLLGTGCKYTQLQPKFKTVFEGIHTGLVNKDLVFGMFKQKFITFLKLGKLITAVNFFYHCPLKLRFFLNGKWESPSFVWRALVSRSMNQLFFSFIPFSLLPSSFQKKINFIQFNAFLKNARWSFLINPKNAAVR